MVNVEHSTLLLLSSKIPNIINTYLQDLSWKLFLLNRVKPIYTRLARICSVEALRERAKRCTESSNFQKYNPEAYAHYVALLKEDKFPPCTEECRNILSKKDWPIDVGIFIACHCYLAQSPLNEHSFFNFGYTATSSDEESTESFAFWDSFSLGGGDTNWWSYVVLKGSVKVPLAPANYAHNNDRGVPVEIFRGGIVAFSHWNHGGCATTAKHIHPDWDPSEFGFAKVSILTFKN